MSVGHRIKELRKKSKQTISDLATILEISGSALSQLENNKFMPSSEVVIKICEHFKITSDYLLFGNDKIIENNNHVTYLEVNKDDNEIDVEIGEDNIIVNRDILKKLVYLTNETIKSKNEVIQIEKEFRTELIKEKNVQIELHEEIKDLLRKKQ